MAEHTVAVNTILNLKMKHNVNSVIKGVCSLNLATFFPLIHDQVAQVQKSQRTQKFHFKSIRVQSRETRGGTYTCRYTNGHLIPNAVADLGGFQGFHGNPL